MGNQASGGSGANRRRHRGGNTGPLGGTMPSDSLMSLSLRGSGGILACNCDPDTAALLQSSLAQSYRPGLKWCNHEGRLWSAKLQGQPWHSQCPREIDQMAKHSLCQLLQALLRAGWRQPVAIETLRRSQLCTWLFVRKAPLPEAEVFCLAPCCSDRLLLLGRPPPGAFDAVSRAVLRFWPKGLRPATAAPGASCSRATGGQTSSANQKQQQQQQQQQQQPTELRLRGNPWNAYERELRDASQCLAGCVAVISDLSDGANEAAAAGSVRWQLAVACSVRASQPSCLFFYSSANRPDSASNCSIIQDSRAGCSSGEFKNETDNYIVEKNHSNGLQETDGQLECRYRLLGFAPPDSVRIMPADSELLAAFYRRLTKSPAPSDDLVQQNQEQLQLLQPQQQQQQQHHHLRLGGSPWRPNSPEEARSARLAVLNLLMAASSSCSPAGSYWLPRQPIRASGRVTEKPCLLLTPTIRNRRTVRLFCLAPVGARSLLIAGATSHEVEQVRSVLQLADAFAAEEQFLNASSSSSTTPAAVCFELNRRFWSTGSSTGACSSVATSCCCCCCCCCGGGSGGGGGGGTMGSAGHWLLLAIIGQLTTTAAAAAAVKGGGGRKKCRLLCAADACSRLISRSDTVPEDWPTLWLAVSHTSDD